MEAFFLIVGYLIAALLFCFGWKRRRPVRITVALFAGASVGAQTVVWHFLLLFGGAWNGGADRVWLVWVMPVAIYLALTTGLLMQDDSPLPLSSPRSKEPALEEKYGPLR